MKPIPIGYQATLELTVTDEMTVDFEHPHDPRLGKLHAVYATYWMAKHMEMAGRMIILDFLEEGEEGIGSKVSVNHLASALPGMKVRLLAEHTRTEGNRVYAALKVWNELGDLIGEGETEQVILPKGKLERIFEKLQERWASFQQAKS
ncbi:thioesterase family protein [Calidithermus roseus]|uniref:Fluoroacetyl-CoA thioesterase n=1 Tax=Calidithermus roseus TaxID=1644118 RepID=A0A399EP15_9DEIN|nr:thioesterase family protein [Calidithermus roseus]RIH86367.1 Fluoroacetyl-CoA thioesterase [Calidithermus roseus]